MCSLEDFNPTDAIGQPLCLQDEVACVAKGQKSLSKGVVEELRGTTVLLSIFAQRMTERGPETFEELSVRSYSNVIRVRERWPTG